MTEYHGSSEVYICLCGHHLSTIEYDKRLCYKCGRNLDLYPPKVYDTDTKKLVHKGGI